MACVYEKDSLIVVEKRSRGHRFELVEYQISQGRDNVRRVDVRGKVLMECEKSVSEKSKMCIVRTDTQMLIIICNWDFMIDIIAFTI